MTVCKFGNSEIEVDMITGDDGKETLHFRHPLSGVWCRSIDIILNDMNKYYEKKKADFAALVEHVKNDRLLQDKVIENDREKEYF